MDDILQTKDGQIFNLSELDFNASTMVNWSGNTHQCLIISPLDEEEYLKIIDLNLINGVFSLSFVGFICYLGFTLLPDNWKISKLLFYNIFTFSFFITYLYLLIFQTLKKESYVYIGLIGISVMIFIVAITYKILDLLELLRKAKKE